MQNLFKQRIKNGSPIRPPEETSADFSKALIFFGTRVPEKSGGRCRYCDPIRFDPIGLQKLARFSQSNPIFSFLYPCVSFFARYLLNMQPFSNRIECGPRKRIEPRVLLREYSLLEIWDEYFNLHFRTPCVSFCARYLLNLQPFSNRIECGPRKRIEIRVLLLEYSLWEICKFDWVFGRNGLSGI